jgi:2-polyprenyl-6-methoxyphenol hydroxylase-like FAD-dependent oxidoreductase
MQVAMEQEVLIVGAGPTGLTTAIELTRRGVKTSIIDKRPGMSNLARAVGITPASLDLLRPSGATELLVQQGIKLESIRIHYNSNELSIPFSRTKKPSKYKYILALPQEQTEAVLSQVLAQSGVQVRYNTSLTSFKQSHEGVIATCDNGITEQYSYLIGADGVHSTIRKSVGFQFNGTDLDDKWSIADIETNQTPENCFNLNLLDKGRMYAIVPLSESRARVVANFPDALSALTPHTQVTAVHRQADFDIAVRQVNTYQKGNVLLAGDAAHCHSPVGGRGMNLGIADAAYLARCIAGENVTAYSTNRHPAGWSTIANSERFRKLLCSTQPLVRGALTSTLNLTARSNLLQRRLIDQYLYA